MTEPVTTPLEQVPATPPEPVTPAPAPTPPATPAPSDPTPTPPQPAKAPEGYIDVARFNGAMRKIEELTIANRALQSDLQTKTSEIEQLRAELANKDIEKTVAVGERDKNLENALTRNQELETENLQLKAFKMKVEKAQEIGHPELISILHTIPDIQDPEVLKSVMGDFVQFRQDGIEAREKVLLSGVTPPTPPAPNTTPTPETNEDWEKYVNSLPVGSAERQKAFDQWFNWQQQQK